MTNVKGREKGIRPPIWALGVVLLLVTVTVSVVAHADRGPATGQDAPATRPTLSTARVIGFGYVDIDSGASALSPATLGQVTEVLAREGESVAAGSPLLKLNSTLAEAQLRQADAAVREAAVRLEQAKRAPLLHALVIEQQSQAVMAAKAKRDAQKQQVDRAERLRESQVLPDEQVDSAVTLSGQLEASVRAEEAKLKQLSLEEPKEALALAQAALDVALARQAVARELVAQHTLLAPEAGLVLRVFVAKGQMLSGSAKNPAIWFCPLRPRMVRCEIDQEFVGRLKVDMPAHLVAEGSHEETWTGRVTRLADWIAPRRSLLDEPFQQNDVRTLEVFVAFDAGKAPPRIGQRMRVIIGQL